MNKPNWDNAPEWANYLAMDSNGEWYWYENKPSDNVCEQWGVKSGKVEVAFLPSDVWEDSLEKRPEVNDDCL